MSEYKKHIAGLARGLCRGEVLCDDFLRAASEFSNDEKIAQMMELVAQAPKINNYIDSSPQGTHTKCLIYGLEIELRRESPIEITMTATDIIVAVHAEWLRCLSQNNAQASSYSSVDGAILELQEIAVRFGDVELCQLLDDMNYVSGENCVEQEEIGGKVAYLVPLIAQRVEALSKKASS